MRLILTNSKTFFTNNRNATNPEKRTLLQKNYKKVSISD